MNYYKQQNQSVRRAKLIRGIKIVCWCIAVLAIIGVIGNDEFKIKLALGIL